MACRLHCWNHSDFLSQVYCQLDPWEQNSLIFWWKFIHFRSINCFWTCRLQNVGYFVDHFVAWWAPSHFLNQCSLIINLTYRTTFIEIHLKTLSTKCWPFYPGGNELTVKILVYPASLRTFPNLGQKKDENPNSGSICQRFFLLCCPLNTCTDNDESQWISYK